MRKLTGLVPKQFLLGLLGGMMVAGYGWVGESDYQNEVASFELYCQMAKDGLWPEKPEMACPRPPLTPPEHLVSL